MQKFTVPEKLTALCASNSGKYMVGGGSSGRLYFWDVRVTKRFLISFFIIYNNCHIYR
jgi:hypothetical protein